MAISHMYNGVWLYLLLGECVCAQELNMCCGNPNLPYHLVALFFLSLGLKT